MRSLNVYIDQTRVGVLSEGDNIWKFTYDSRWPSSATSFDLSPALPRSTLEHLDGSTLRPVQWYFDNLLPEERLRMAVARDAGLKDVDDSFALQGSQVFLGRVGGFEAQSAGDFYAGGRHAALRDGILDEP